MTRGDTRLLLSSSYAGINRIKFAGLIDHLSTFTVHPGQHLMYAIFSNF